MIKGKLALLTCALTLALTSPLLAAQNVSEGQTLKLAIGPEPTEGFDPMLLESWQPFAFACTIIKTKRRYELG